MRLGSIIDSFAQKIVLFFDDTEVKDENQCSSKRIAKLEKSVHSQSKRYSKKYNAFLESNDPNIFEISDFAIRESLKNRIGKNIDFYTLHDILNDQEIDYLIEYNSLNDSGLHRVALSDCYEHNHSELVSLFIAYVQDIRNHLRGKRIIKLITSFLSKKRHSLNLRYLQIPLIHSFLAFFDQVFTLKDVERSLSFEFSTLLNVSIKNSNNEKRRINRFVPVFSGT